ncbi:CU044_2847 family protein [Streptomyces sp. NPDC094473]|uniref:CU044_2847 family protein n=1 Tax=Streptomyces TaxID=1883 RepID=UPI001F505178|nr:MULTISPECIES: CU044_2847 family protein [Streptomyces]
MSDFMEFEFDDGSSLALQVFPAATPAEGSAPGFGTSVPVARGSRLGAVAGTALRGVLAPLVPLLQQVRDTAAAVPDPPDEISVSFGVRVGHDLKLGVVGVAGEATLTVTANWHLGQQATTDG